MKAIIIDDEKHAITRLIKLLEQISAITEIVAFDDPLEALGYLTHHKQDLIFLDVEMPMHGLEVFGRIMEIQTYIPVIFTTAYDQYAIKAFELNAIDYLLKPFRLERLQISIDRVVHYYRTVQHEDDSEKNKKLRIVCFKRLSMYYGDEIINLNWRTKKADELIAFLLCEEGNFVSKDKIINSLWSELDSKKGMNNLYTTLYYIRCQAKKSNVKIPIESLRGKMRINIEDIDVDMMKLARIYQFYKEGKVFDIEEVQDLYKGMLLEEHDYPWSIILQSHYENMFLELFGL